MFLSIESQKNFVINIKKISQSVRIRFDLSFFYYTGKFFEHSCIIKNAPRGSHCDGDVDVAKATRRMRRISLARFYFGIDNRVTL